MENVFARILRDNLRNAKLPQEVGPDSTGSAFVLIWTGVA
jgi:hypothetical protein